MTDQQHPITPPLELVQQWWDFADQHCDRDDPKTYFDDIATQAARWGADIELEACVEWMRSHFHGVPQWADQLRAARRPKPPSLAEEALAKTEAILNDPSRVLLTEVREALECNRRTLRRLQGAGGRQ